MTLHVHIVAQGQDDALNLSRELPGRTQYEGLCIPQTGVNGLEHANGECGRLSRTRLSLSNDVPAADDGQNGSLLDGGGSFEVVGIDAAQEVLLEAQGFEGGCDLYIFGRLEIELAVAGVDAWSLRGPMGE